MSEDPLPPGEDVDALALQILARAQARGGGGDVGQLGLCSRGRLVARTGLRAALVEQQAGAVGQARGRLALADPLVGGGRPRAQPGDDVGARGHEPGGGGGQLGVPHLQAGDHGGRHAPGPAGGAGRLQQAGALGEDLVVLGAHPGQRGAQGHGQVVQETTAHPRLLAHQGEVLWGEDDGAQDAQQVAGPHGGAVEPGAVGPAGDDLYLQDAGSPAVDDPGPHDRSAGLRLARRGTAHQGGVSAGPVAGEGRQVGDRLDEVGLALPVGPDEGRGAGLQGEDELVVGAEVTECKV